MTFDAETTEAMIADYYADMTLRQIARKYKCTHTRVRRALLANDVPMRLPGFRSTARDTRIMQLHKAGYSLAQIGSELGITRQRVHQVIDRNLNEGKTDEGR